MAAPSHLTRQDGLERRFDGPVPPDDPADIDRPQSAGRARLFQRLAAERRDTIARRRSGLSGLRAPTDRWLQGAVRALEFYRHQGAAWMD